MRSNLLSLGDYGLPINNLSLFYGDLEEEGWYFFLKSPPGWRIFVSAEAVDPHIGMENWERLLEALFNGEEIENDLFISTHCNKVRLITSSEL